MKNETVPCRWCKGTGRQPNQVVIGNRLRERRITAKKSLRSVAKEMGVSAAYLSDLELGRRTWSVERITEVEELTK